jgi:hypothetical protein
MRFFTSPHVRKSDLFTSWKREEMNRREHAAAAPSAPNRRTRSLPFPHNHIVRAMSHHRGERRVVKESTEGLPIHSSQISIRQEIERSCEHARYLW